MKDERIAIKFSCNDAPTCKTYGRLLAHYIIVANLSSTRDRMNALSLQSPHDVASLIGADWTIS
jgi:hypothetical protein